jgi:hypothetical protein
MIATMISPEVLLAKAKDWAATDAAERELSDFEDYAVEDGVSWTETHTHFANMGGFVLRSNTNNPDASLERTGSAAQAATSLDSSGGTHQNSLSKSEIPVETSAKPTKTEFNTTSVSQIQSESRSDGLVSSLDPELQHLHYHEPFHLTAGKVLRLRKDGLIKLPPITRDEIEDKSKGDAFVKAIAVAQISWTIFQIALRANRKLAVSQLEIAVVAFSACAIIIYFIIWKRPKGVRVPYTLHQYPGPIPVEVHQSLNAPIAPSEPSLLDDRLFSGILGFRAKKSSQIAGACIANDLMSEEYSYATNMNKFLPYLQGLSVGSMVFGGLHMAAWNLVFPTRSEQIAWRAAALWCFVSPWFVGLSIVVFAIRAEDIESEDAPKWFVPLQRVIFFSYVLARFYLLVQIFRTLWFHPPNAYVATWASNIPHVH